MERLVDCANATLAEIDRLQKHPDLLLDLDMSLGFFEGIAKSIIDLEQILQLREGHDLEIDYLSEVAERELDDIFLPSQDERRTMWQQFFHGNAPGLPLQEGHKTSDGISQGLPYPACRSLDSFATEQKRIRSKLGLVSFPLHTSF